MYIHKEGFPTLIILIIVLAVLNIVCFIYAPLAFWPLLVISVLFYFFIIHFFRNPKRAISEISDQFVYAPADGKVVVIEKVFEPEYFKQELQQISIFMSPLNVHVNRHPVNGTVAYQKYHPGKYMAAWNPKASTENERTTVAYDTARGPVLMRQIAGALARRIVCYAQKDDKATQGGEMGFIKFGSRVDIFIPLEATVNVKIGDRVSGNLDVIAKY